MQLLFHKEVKIQRVKLGEFVTTIFPWRHNSRAWTLPNAKNAHLPLVQARQARQGIREDIIILTPPFFCHQPKHPAHTTLTMSIKAM